MTDINHNSEIVLDKKLQTAAEQVPIGGIYAHYKHPELLYEIVGHCMVEATERPAVIYRAQYGKKITWARELGVFLETVEYEGKTVPRFTRIANESASE